METLSFTIYGIGALAAITAAALKLYAHGYSRGYENGKRYGFSDGLNYARRKSPKSPVAANKSVVAVP
tara:strand:- start:5467 stop:5670 length:204 start_codon:yes stop_codon:yes gene_type:complete